MPKKRNTPTIAPNFKNTEQHETIDDTVSKPRNMIQHGMVLGALFLVLFATLAFISTQIKAQQYSAGVAAVVAPNPYNTRPPKQTNFFERMDIGTKFTVGSSAALVFMTAILFLLLHKPRKHLP